MLIEANDPSISDVMGLLKHLNKQELNDLLNDESRLESMIRDSQKVTRHTSILLLHVLTVFLHFLTRLNFKKQKRKCCWPVISLWPSII